MLWATLPFSVLSLFYGCIAFVLSVFALMLSVVLSMKRKRSQLLNKAYQILQLDFRLGIMAEIVVNGTG